MLEVENVDERKQRVGEFYQIYRNTRNAMTVTIYCGFVSGQCVSISIQDF